MRFLNTDDIYNPALVLRIAAEFPPKTITLGAVVDPESDVGDAESFARKVRPLFAGLIWRCFDSYSLMLRDRRGKPISYRYAPATYTHRAESFMEAFPNDIHELGNELSPDDPKWIPKNIHACVSSALDAAKRRKVQSLVTWWMDKNTKQWHRDNPLYPDIYGASIYPRATDYDWREAIRGIAWMAGTAPHMTSEFGSQDGDGKISIRTENKLIRDFASIEPMDGYLGSIPWNAVSNWKKLGPTIKAAWNG